MTGQRQRLRIAVLFGGRSSEHEVSIMSATNVMAALDVDRYEPVPIYIGRDGRWLLSSYAKGELSRPAAGVEACLLAGGRGRMIAVEADGSFREMPPIGMVFPVLHGLHGEDGAAQGLVAVAQVPLAGCGILGSAAALDKDIAKRLLRDAGIPTARSVTLRSSDTVDFGVLEAELGLPMFVKPARQGSSVGVAKVADQATFSTALEDGFYHDSKLLVEEFVAGREIECSVLEDAKGGLFVSRPGEIVPSASHGFYTYDAKYVDPDGAALRVPADLPDEIEAAIRTMAADAFRAIGCDGMARVDFFVTTLGRILVNEVNTIPGFTDISMYPKAMEASGMSYGEIIDRLVEHGLARFARSG